MENEDIEYQVENKANEENIVYDNEVGAPPLVVVVQGGKGVNITN
jgi:hypothetical protein